LVKNTTMLQLPEVIMRSLATRQGATHTDARQEALAWLAAQLRWERTLDQLRGGEDETPVPQAA
jgi:hypothetical protein